MKYSVTIFVFLLNLSAQPVLAKNCPSKLAAHLKQVGEKELYWGLEFRLGNYHILEKDPTSDNDKFFDLHRGFMALRTNVDYSPAAWLNFFFEGEVKIRNEVENCNNWAIPLNNKFEFIPQLRQVNTNINKWDFNFTLGRQNLVFGTQAVLDNFFDAVKISKYWRGKLKLELFAGAFATEIARETLGCGYEQFYENRGAWKRLCSANYGDYLLFGAQAKLRYKWLRPHRISMLSIVQWSRNDVEPELLSPEYPENFTANFTALHGTGPFFTTKLRYTAELITSTKIPSGKVIPAAVFGLKYRLNLGKGTRLVFLPYYTGSFSQDDHNNFAPLFERYDLGMRQRYGLYNGHIYSFMLKFKHKRSFRIHTGYHYRTNNFVSQNLDDEIEAGFTWFYKGNTKYQFRTFYSVINVFAGKTPISHGIRFVLRIIY
ncbi:MAG: hypothetical protein PF689_01830 [Deltaproteobacteria bacterium]|jgi:hypothetical protein|nr:hypothetical protein [Deltaproteobacteria bacterium]